MVCSRGESLTHRTNQMKTIQTPSGHRLSVNGIALTGREIIWHDNKIVSDKFSVTGGTYFFDVTEGGNSVQYEVKFGTRWNGTCWHEMRMNGKIFFADR